MSLSFLQSPLLFAAKNSSTNKADLTSISPWNESNIITRDHRESLLIKMSALLYHKLNKLFQDLQTGLLPYLDQIEEPGVETMLVQMQTLLSDLSKVQNELLITREMANESPRCKTALHRNANAGSMSFISEEGKSFEIAATAATDQKYQKEYSFSTMAPQPEDDILEEIEQATRALERQKISNNPSSPKKTGMKAHSKVIREETNLLDGKNVSSTATLPPAPPPLPTHLQPKAKMQIELTEKSKEKMKQLIQLQVLFHDFMKRKGYHNLDNQ